MNAMTAGREWASRDRVKDRDREIRDDRRTDTEGS